MVDTLRLSLTVGPTSCSDTELENTEQRSTCVQFTHNDTSAYFLKLKLQMERFSGNSKNWCSTVLGDGTKGRDTSFFKI